MNNFDWKCSKQDKECILNIYDGNISIFEYLKNDIKYVEIVFYNLEDLFRIFCLKNSIQFKNTTDVFYMYFTKRDNLENVRNDIDEFLNKCRILLPFI